MLKNIRSSLAIAFAAITILGMGAGCAVRHNYNVTDRELVGIKDGGSGEVWIVMTEENRETDGKYVAYRKAAYVVYQCVPAGCKRVGELKGSQVLRREDQ